MYYYFCEGNANESFTDRRRIDAAETAAAAVEAVVWVLSAALIPKLIDWLQVRNLQSQYPNWVSDDRAKSSIALCPQLCR